MPESPLNYQVERTAEGHFVKGQSGNPAGKPPGCRNHATRIAETLLGMLRQIVWKLRDSGDVP